MYTLLKKTFEERGITQTKVAKFLGISRTAFNRKINLKGTDFSLEEMRKLCTKYKLSARKMVFHKK